MKNVVYICKNFLPYKVSIADAWNKSTDENWYENIFFVSCNSQIRESAVFPWNSKDWWYCNYPLLFWHFWFIQRNFSQPNWNTCLHNPITVSWAHSRESLMMKSTYNWFIGRNRFKPHILRDQLAEVAFLAHLQIVPNLFLKDKANLYGSVRDHKL